MAIRLLPFLLLLAFFPLSAQTDQAWHLKIDDRLETELNRNGTAEMLVVMQEQADISAAYTLPGKQAKGDYVYNTLVQKAETTQRPLRDLLRAAGAPVHSFWIVNAIWTQGDVHLLEILARRPEVARIEANPKIPVEQLPDRQSISLERNTTVGSWGLLQINADDVWNLGYEGGGIVVGGQDTGYEWEHPAIKNRYRGWNGSTADHNYNWHDAISALIGGGSNSCGLSLSTPCDDNGHGTHTMGTMVGKDEVNDITYGVAPLAEWMGCRNMEEGDGTPATYIECFQWFAAPTDLSGLNPNVAMSPHVINNSWGCPTSEGCNAGNYATMETVVNNVRASGIVVVVSAGNSGPGCSSIDSPAAIFDASFTVGATASNDVIAGFSSRGPVNVYTGIMKPDISAPGVGIPSCVGTDNNSGTYGYVSFNGTSMAGPHIAGSVALILSAKPALIGNVDAVENLIKNTAQPLYASSPFCGSDNGSSLPNNVYGYGRVNALAAVSAALPVELLEFSVKPYPNSAALLQWRTASEYQCAAFELERSADGRHWQPFGRTDCYGNNSRYSFVDENPLPGTGYYRLWQVDHSGLRSVSPIVSLHLPGPALGLRATPDRITHSVLIEVLGSSEQEQWEVKLFSLDGRLLQTAPVETTTRLALPDLPSGIYWAGLYTKDGRMAGGTKWHW